MAMKNETSDVTAEWLIERGGKYQECGGAYSFFGERDERSPLLWIDVRTDGTVTLALVADRMQMHHWVGTRTREEIDTLLRLLIDARPTTGVDI